MHNNHTIYIFGEVLFDCFPTGEEILGGAPFNVAWHLQAFGDTPLFISRIGEDPQGETIDKAMHTWGMTLEGLQRDPIHPTGRVDVAMVEGEPHYTITPDCAYDFIESTPLHHTSTQGILYHGTLGLRNTTSKSTLQTLTKNHGLSIFVDVNLRTPWWNQEEVYTLLESASWVKLNEEELRVLGFTDRNIHHAIEACHAQFHLEQLIVTRGAQGAIVYAGGIEFHTLTPEPISQIIDSVGAGDAFTAMYLHGLLNGWSIPKSLTYAQKFAGRVIGLRGATTNDRHFYDDFCALSKE